jgi:hypothetical protein
MSCTGRLLAVRYETGYYLCAPFLANYSTGIAVPKLAVLGRKKAGKDSVLLQKQSLSQRIFQRRCASSALMNSARLAACEACLVERKNASIALSLT